MCSAKCIHPYNLYTCEPSISSTPKTSLTLPNQLQSPPISRQYYGIFHQTLTLQTSWTRDKPEDNRLQHLKILILLIEKLGLYSQLLKLSYLISLSLNFLLNGRAEWQQLHHRTVKKSETMHLKMES